LPPHKNCGFLLIKPQFFLSDFIGLRGPTTAVSFRITKKAGAFFGKIMGSIMLFLSQRAVPDFLPVPEAELPD